MSLTDDEQTHEVDAERSDPTPVHVLMAKVLAELPAIGKDDQAPEKMGGYQFRGIESITAQLKPLLGKFGVFVVPDTLERMDSTRSVGGQGKQMFCVDVHVRFTFFGPRGDSVVASAWGQGTDMGDKATQKAYTSAFKSMLAVAFCIADSATDSERHELDETTELIDPDTVQQLRERMNALPGQVRADLREQWAALDGLRGCRPSQLERVPADRLDLIDSLVNGAEARARSETTVGATQSDALPLDGAQAPDDPSDADKAAQMAEAEQLLGADPPDDWVRAIIEQTSDMGAEAVDAELRTWTLPKGGNLNARRKRLAIAMVRDALRPPS